MSALSQVQTGELVGFAYFRRSANGTARERFWNTSICESSCWKLIAGKVGTEALKRIVGRRGDAASSESLASCRLRIANAKTQRCLWVHLLSLEGDRFCGACMFCPACLFLKILEFVSSVYRLLAAVDAGLPSQRHAVVSCTVLLTPAKQRGFPSGK